MRWRTAIAVRLASPFLAPIRQRRSCCCCCSALGCAALQRPRFLSLCTLLAAACRCCLQQARSPPLVCPLPSAASAFVPHPPFVRHEPLFMFALSPDKSLSPFHASTLLHLVRLVLVRTCRPWRFLCVWSDLRLAHCTRLVVCVRALVCCSPVGAWFAHSLSGSQVSQTDRG